MLNTDCKVTFARELREKGDRLEVFAEEALERYGCLDEGWRFKWLGDSFKKALGVCSYREKYIGLSARAVAFVSEEKLQDTVLHEVAHVLAGRLGDNGHGRIWRRMCHKVGAVPRATYSLSREEVAAMSVTSKDVKYFLTCNKCGYSDPYYRRPRRNLNNIYCGDCNDTSSRFELIDAASGVVLESGVAQAS